MIVNTWLLFSITYLALAAKGEIHADGDVSDAIRSLQEQVNALLDHRQQDYNALEGSLKRAIEKNTELFVLKNEIKQLRKEVISLRGGNGNEVKNERLRVRWLGSAVTELQGEVAEVLRTRNASEELAERSRMKGEFSLLKGDVAAVGRGIRNLGGRIAKIEAVLGTIRVDITAVKERFSMLSRTCADITSQLNSVQIELKSLRCDSSLSAFGNSVNRHEEGNADGPVASASSTSPDTVAKEEDRKNSLATDRGLGRRRFTRRHDYMRRNEGYRMRLEDRLKNIERKISLSVQKRVSLEKSMTAYGHREWTSLSKRIKSLEKTRFELSREISNVSLVAATWTKAVGDSLSSQLIASLGALEETIETNTSAIKGELARLDVNAARKAAELSLTREELNSLRRTVQALSVSASKLQERSDKQQLAIDRLNGSFSSTSHLYPPRTYALLTSHEQMEDRYHLIRNNLTNNCWFNVANEPLDGLRLLDVGKESSPVLVFCRKGWTVVARRIDGTLDFDRSWNDYSLGFGTPVGEYWIGNEVLHWLTRDNCSRLRIDMRDIYGERWRAEYELFAVESEETGYRLHVQGFTGNATDALSYQNGMAFSAKDRDMDASSAHCAKNYHGGWWFSRCQHANLNGKYSLGLSWFRSDTNQWMSIASSEMSVRPNFDCQSR